MVDDVTPDDSMRTELRPADVADKQFSHSFRGLEPDEVRGFLQEVAARLGALQARERDLERRLAEVQAQLAHPTIDEPMLLAALGEETAQVLHTARSAAADLKAKAEEHSSAALKAANDEATKIRATATAAAEQITRRAEAVLAERTSEAERVAGDILAEARATAAKLVADAEARATALRSEAETRATTLRSEAEASSRALVAKAEEERDAVLAELARKRRKGQEQIERLRDGRAQLLDVYRLVRSTLEDVTEALAASENTGETPVVEAIDDDEPGKSGRGQGSGARGPDPAPGGPRTPPPARPRPSQPERPVFTPSGGRSGGGGSPPPPREPSIGSPPGAADWRAPTARAVTEPGGRALRLAEAPEVLAEEARLATLRFVRHSAPAYVPVDQQLPVVEPPAEVEEVHVVRAEESAPRATDAPTVEPDAAVEKVEAVVDDAAVADEASAEPEAVEEPASAEEPEPEPAVEVAVALEVASIGPAPLVEVAVEPEPEPEAEEDGRGPVLAAYFTITADAEWVDDTGGAAEEPAAADESGVEAVGPAEAEAALPEPEAQEPRDHEPEAEVDAATSPTDGDHVPASTSAEVDDLFARLRAARADAVTDARSVLAQPAEPEATNGTLPAPVGENGTAHGEPGSGGSNGVSAEVERPAEPAPVRPEATATKVPATRVAPEPAGPANRAAWLTASEPVVRKKKKPPVPVPSAPPSVGVAEPTDDEGALQVRDRVVEPLEALLVKRLKRVLQDEQNGLLDRLRGRSRPTAADLVGNREALERPFAGVLAPLLVEAAQAGVVSVDPNRSRTSSVKVDDLVGDVSGVIAKSLVPALAAALDEARKGPGADDDLVRRIGSAFREWRGEPLARLASDAVATAYARGAYSAFPAGTPLRWIADDGGASCPDCEDNSLAGGTPKGTAFPTGQRHPPAHSGCRCLLVRDASGDAATG